MESAVAARAAGGRSRVFIAAAAGSPSIDPSAAEVAAGAAGQADRSPQIDCIRTWFAGEVIDDAACRAAALRVGADRVQIPAGALSEEAYLRAFAAALGVTFEPLDGTPRECCSLSDDRLIESATAGMVPARDRRRTVSGGCPTRHGRRTATAFLRRPVKMSGAA